MSKLVSDEYREILEKTHEEDVNWGRGPARAIYEVCHFIRENNIFHKTVLDYGCGKGMLRHILSPMVKVSSYDPGVPKFSKLPDPSEYTVCCDVMEHVEEDKLHDVLQHISEVTKASAFFDISVEPSKKILPDGRNAHITLKTREEWITILSNYFQLEVATSGLNSLRYQGRSLYWMDKREKSATPKGRTRFGAKW